MTELTRDPEASHAHDGEACPQVPVLERLAVREADVEGFTIRRALPNRHRRLVGAWCFLDHLGPVDVTGTEGMQVGPHPHTGLQTVTWLLDGQVLHRDSLGSELVIRPGELNLMTSGHGISHSEESPLPVTGSLHATQLWLALPEAVRHGPAAFEHHEDLPTVGAGGFTGTVFCGTGLGATSPATVHSPLVGAHLSAPAQAAGRLDLDPAWEHALLVLRGTITVDGQSAGTDELLYLGTHREAVDLRAVGDTDVLLVGGEPFGEDVLVWWNFVGRTRDEVSESARQWNAEDERFGEVVGFDGPRIPSPTPPWERTKRDERAGS